MGTFTTFAYFDLIGRITLEKCQQQIWVWINTY